MQVLRNPLSTPFPTPQLLIPKQSSYSVSTEESPRSNPPLNKEKSQLCKRFIENGCCPYQQRCKFAHGLHELKKNHQQNSKYKTKTCGSFLQDGCCLFGNRCNFIHTSTQIVPKANLRQLDPEMLEIRCSVTSGSRLMRLLHEKQWYLFYGMHFESYGRHLGGCFILASAL